ncbi:GEgh16 protein, putative [Rhizoctonia solani AG-3 Rhs1AP]|uniref:GEgh16 protein, putative n=1 Tax=Rhizoctonia solani AG-3 Rhs1AP TaxID=1086054 RepID=X8JAV3_9AGAM|nr:GEgh16 protein, putative [Rhizoctonia solani AG-3 Rhs1AP]
MLSSLLCLSALVSLVTAHATIVSVQGANSIDGAGMGIDPTTPRDGTRANPFQRDTSIIRDNEINSGRVGPCGRTNQKGALDIAGEMEGRLF